MNKKTVIKVRVYRRRFAGDNSSYIETHVINSDKLGWWKQRSGKGDFDLIEHHEYGSCWGDRYL